MDKWEGEPGFLAFQGSQVGLPLTLSTSAVGLVGTQLFLVVMGPMCFLSWGARSYPSST